MFAHTNQSADHSTATDRSRWSAVVRFILAVMKSAGDMALVLLATDLFDWELFIESPSQRLTFVLLWAFAMTTWRQLVRPQFFWGA